MIRRHLVRHTSTYGPQPTADYAARLATGLAFLHGKHAVDIRSVVQQPIAWNDHDTYRHVNNARYLIYMETGRMAFLREVLEEKEWRGLVDGEAGLGIILSGLSIKYKRPVTYPDTLLVGHHTEKIGKDRFSLASVCYSLAQEAVTTTSSCDLVTYDHTLHKKIMLPDHLREELEKRLPHGHS